MLLQAGARLGPYQLTAPIGAGGMGEVWQARDTGLGRDVALKFLTEAVASDPERLARFKREAQLLAALNHPGIAAIYGLDEREASRSWCSSSSRARTSRSGSSAVRCRSDEAVAVARQVAEALEEAHERGIVHRDLKPANVKVTPDGKVKVLDFGLAKAWSGDIATGSSSSSDLSQSPTLARTEQRSWPDPGHRRLHVARAGARQGRRQALGCLGLRRDALRAAHGSAPLRRRDGERRARRGAHATAGVDRAPCLDAAGGEAPARALPRARPEAAPARHRRSAHRSRRRSGSRTRVRLRRAGWHRVRGCGQPPGSLRV